MAFLNNVKNSLDILLFNEKSIDSVANSPSATVYGLLTLIIAGLASAIQYALQVAAIGLLYSYGAPNMPFVGSQSPDYSVALNFVLHPVWMILSFIICYSFFHFVAKFFLGGVATGVQYFRVLSCAFVVYWLGVVPFLGIIWQYIAAIWLIATNIFVLHKVHKLSMARSVILGLMPLVVLALVVIAGAAYIFSIAGPTIR